MLQNKIISSLSSSLVLEKQAIKKILSLCSAIKFNTAKFHRLQKDKGSDKL